MSFATLSKTIGRRACTVVELLVDTCTRTYGLGLCHAAVGVTGTQKCFNTRKTCQFPSAYDVTPKSYRFSNCQIAAPDTAHPTLVGNVSVAPTKIDPANSLGLRATITFTIRDEPSTDTDTDPYFRTRSYVPFNQGTYWGKWLARNPYYQNRLCKVYTGFLTEDGSFDVANFEVRTYVLSSISGPDTNTRMVKITAKDILALVDNDKAQCPAPCSATLATDIDESVLAADLLPVGVGDLEFPTNGTICVGSECMTFSRVPGTDHLVFSARGTDHTGPDPYVLTGVQHSAGDSVQLCKRFTNVFVTDVLYDLLVNYGSIPTSYIDLAAWNAEAAVWLGGHYLSTLLCKPYGVTTLLNEIIQQCLCYFWWDERSVSIPFRAVRPAVQDEAIPVNEMDNIVADSATVTEDPSQRLSQVLVRYIQFNPVLPIDRFDNYDGGQLSQDQEAETAFEYGEVKIRTIYSRWFTAANRAQALVLGQRMLNKYRSNPRTFKVVLDMKDYPIWTGSFVDVQTMSMQDESGASPNRRMEVISVSETKPGFQLTYEMQDTFFNGRYGYVTPNLYLGSAFPNYIPAPQSLKDRYGFITENNGLMSNGDPGYKII